MYNNKKITAVISMARPKKYNIQLTDKELAKLRSVIRKKETSRTIRSRCQIIIDLDEAHGKVLTHEQSATLSFVLMRIAGTGSKTLSVPTDMFSSAGIGNSIKFDCSVCI